MQIRLEACFRKEVYTNFVKQEDMRRPTREEFIRHLDICPVCQQAVRTIEREAKEITPKLVRIAVVQGNQELGKVEIELQGLLLSEELDQLAGKFGFVEAVKALAKIAKLQVFPMPVDTSGMNLW